MLTLTCKTPHWHWPGKSMKKKKTQDSLDLSDAFSKHTCFVQGKGVQILSVSNRKETVTMNLNQKLDFKSEYCV